MSVAQRFTEALDGRYPKSEAQAIAFAMIEHLTGWSRTYLLTHPEAEPTAEQSAQLNDAIERLKRFEPIQYIIGTTVFCGLPFHTDHRALIPRPETEELVEWCMEHPHHEILDIGTGTGCIAISLAHQLPEAHVTAFDLVKETLSLAEENARLNEVSVDFVAQDILRPTWTPKKRWDLIVSNPPYIAESEQAEMDHNVLDHEPHVALFVPDNDPLVFYRAIADYAVKHLECGGELLVESNQKLFRETADLFKGFGFEEIEIRHDINNNPRMIRGVKR